MSENNTKKRRFISRIQVIALLEEIQKMAAAGHTKIGIYEKLKDRMTISYAQFCRACIQYGGMEKRKKAKNHSMKKPEKVGHGAGQDMQMPSRGPEKGTQGPEEAQARASAQPPSREPEKGTQGPVEAQAAAASSAPDWKSRIVRSKEFLSESEFEALFEATKKMSYSETEKYVDANGYKGKLDMYHLTRLYAGKNVLDDI